MLIRHDAAQSTAAAVVVRQQVPGVRVRIGPMPGHEPRSVVWHLATGAQGRRSPGFQNLPLRHHCIFSAGGELWWHSTTNVIDSVPEEYEGRYAVVQDIQVVFKKVDEHSIVATFEAVDISMTGTSHENAKEELAAALVDFLETFRDDDEFADAVNTLSNYIRRC